MEQQRPAALGARAVDGGVALVRGLARVASRGGGTGDRRSAALADRGSSALIARDFGGKSCDF
jgi:hypothetical protein